MATVPVIKRLTLLLLLFFSLSLEVWAQKETLVKFDTLTNSFDQSLPFDEHFTIQYPNKDKSIYHVDAYKIFTVKGKRSYTSKSVLFLGEKNSKRLKGAVLGINPKGKNVYISMGPLAPHQTIELVLFHRFKGKKQAKLIELFGGMLADADGGADKVKAYGETFKLSLGAINISAFGAKGNWSADWKKSIKAFFTAELKAAFQNISGIGCTGSYTFTHAHMREIGNIAFSKKLPEKQREVLHTFWSNVSRKHLNELECGLLSPEEVEIP